jgi:hypothetical protein
MCAHPSGQPLARFVTAFHLDPSFKSASNWTPQLDEADRYGRPAGMSAAVFHIANDPVIAMGF